MTRFSALSCPRVERTKEKRPNGTFDDCIKEIGILHVPTVALKAYKAAEPWSQFHSIVPLTETEMAVETVEDAQKPPRGIHEKFMDSFLKCQASLRAERMDNLCEKKNCC